MTCRVSTIMISGVARSLLCWRLGRSTGSIPTVPRRYEGMWTTKGRNFSMHSKQEWMSISGNNVSSVLETMSPQFVLWCLNRENHSGLVRASNHREYLHRDGGLVSEKRHLC